MAYVEYAKQVDKSKLDAVPDIKAVDMNRSKRVYDEYVANHPEAGTN